MRVASPIASACREISVGRNVPRLVRQVSLIVDARPYRSDPSQQRGQLRHLGRVDASDVHADQFFARVAQQRATCVVGGQDAVLARVHDEGGFRRVLEDGAGHQVALA